MKKENFAIEFLYKTFLGRLFLKFVTRPVFSKFISKYLNSFFSKWIIGVYIKKYGISLDGCEKSNYSSFNSFFIRRKRKADVQSLDEQLLDSLLIQVWRRAFFSAVKLVIALPYHSAVFIRAVPDLRTVPRAAIAALYLSR